METFIALDLPPGLAKNGTAYQNRNRWINGHLIRFYEGTIRPVGGWTLARTTGDLEVQASGKPRLSYAWRKNDSTSWLSVGTTGFSAGSKLYVFSSGVLTDITPGGMTNGAVDGTVSTGVGMYGAGLYGAGLYGGGLSAGTIIDADTWSLDNFGEILLAVLTSDGKIYESTPTAVAAQVTNSPTCRAVVVTPERFVFALGASSDPRNVAWCSQSTRTLWAAAAGNSAGSFPLQTAGRLVSGRRTDRETLLWTDEDLWSAVYIGGVLIYSFTRRGTSCGLIGPNAVAMGPDGTAYWMSGGQFFQYAGAVSPIPCDVADYVFGDLNMTQRAKIVAVPIAQYGEVWWFYPSSTSLENDRYVNVSYRTNPPSWTTGLLGRGAGTGATAGFPNPMLWHTDGKLYTHETGTDRGGAAVYVESGPLELGTGDRVLRIQSLVPDERILGQVQATIYSAFQPMDTETSVGPYSLAPLTNVRVSGRQFRLRLAEPLETFSGYTADTTVLTADSTVVTADASTLSGTDFRVGSFRAGVIPGGYR